MFSILAILHVPVFYDVVTTQKWPLLGQKQSKITFRHVNLGCENFCASQTFSVFATLHVTCLLRRPNYAKVAVAWRKTVKKQILPR